MRACTHPRTKPNGPEQRLPDNKQSKNRSPEHSFRIPDNCSLLATLSKQLVAAQQVQVSIWEFDPGLTDLVGFWILLQRNMRKLQIWRYSTEPGQTRTKL